MRQHTTRFIVALLLLTVGTQAGCSSTTRPVFEATDAVTTTRTPDGVELLFTINATNANPDSMPLRSVRYALSLDGHTVFTGTRSPEASIPAFGSQSFTLPAVIPSAELIAGETAAEYRITGTVSYKEPGRFNEILFDRKLRVPKARLSVAGTITFDP